MYSIAVGESPAPRAPIYCPSSATHMTDLFSVASLSDPQLLPTILHRSIPKLSAFTHFPSALAPCLYPETLPASSTHSRHHVSVSSHTASNEAQDFPPFELSRCHG